MALQIIPLTKDHIPGAASLFAEGYSRLRQTVASAPARMQDPAVTEEKLEWILGQYSGLAAMQDNRMLGYLSWMILDDFRSPGMRAAFAPEWAHAALPEHQLRVYRALYREAAEIWDQKGCVIHAMTLLAHDRAVIDGWFWSGFGLAVVDAVRPIDPLNVPIPSGFTVRPALAADADAVSHLDADHCQHYTQPPVFMSQPTASSPEEVREFLGHPNNNFWLAWQGEELAAMLKFEHRSFGAASIVVADDTIAITGAYTRPVYRGMGILPALLDAGLRHYGGSGFQCCSVDFESFNPEAAHFWMKYFQPVTNSLFRVPEKGLAALLTG